MYSRWSTEDGSKDNTVIGSVDDINDPNTYLR
jgi:hypothetical protein